MKRFICSSYITVMITTSITTNMEVCISSRIHIPEVFLVCFSERSASFRQRPRDRACLGPGQSRSGGQANRLRLDDDGIYDKGDPDRQAHTGDTTDNEESWTDSHGRPPGQAQQQLRYGSLEMESD